MNQRVDAAACRLAAGLAAAILAWALPGAAVADDVLRLKPGLYEITSSFGGKAGKRRHCMTPEEVKRDIKDTMSRINRAMSKDCQELSFKQESRSSFSGAWQCRGMKLAGRLVVDSDTAYRMSVDIDQGGQKTTTTESGKRIGSC